MAKRKRRFKSLTHELIKKAREAMLSAVQIYNNPQIEFKSELFIVTAVVAWTYLLHAHYRTKRVEYRQIRPGAQRRKFLKTKYGAIRHWSLEECLDSPDCPLDTIAKKNLTFLLGIRHEIEHQMTSRIDEQLSAKFQATALNFNSYIKMLFGAKHSLDAEQAFSIQFSGITEETAKELLIQADLPQNIRSFIVQFENGLSQEEYDNPRFAFRVAFVRKTSNARTAADKVVDFISAGAEINKVFLKETEKKKYRPSTIVKQMKAEGYSRFGMTQHTELWKERDAKNPKFQFGASVEGSWFWYETWLNEVRKHCEANPARYCASATQQPTLAT